MLIYGDRDHEAETTDSIARISDAVTRAQALTGLPRHSALIDALIAAGTLAQGTADAAFETHGQDEPSSRETMVPLMAIADAVRQSWDQGCNASAPIYVALPDAARLPRRIRLRDPEGFAHYALFPETYLQAGRRAALGPDTTVIGLRSIGTTLGAMISAGLGAAAPLTLRPIGHPFRRELSLTEGLAAEFECRRTGAFAIVDEGPGLSGSSFGAAIEMLAAKGADLSRVHVFPSHGGEPGQEASAAHRTLWKMVTRHVAVFDDVLERLPQWAATMLGPATSPIDDIAGGAWRQCVPAPAWPRQERRKFLWRTKAGLWLLKFAGLGALGAAKLDCARRLHEAGFTPPVAGMCHGFLVERWCDETGPLPPISERSPDFTSQLASYLAFRNRALPVPPDAGATPAVLLAMARYNATEAIGAASAARLARWTPHIPALTNGLRRVWTDNRLHAWEWRVRPDGRLLKTDAVDHARAHDLIGCQDIAWDIAGASVELGLTAEQEDALARALARDAVVVAFHKQCYLAFQIGLFSMAAAEASYGERECLAAIATERSAQLEALLNAP